MTKKIFILLPDGVGLKNFAFTSFVKIGEEMGWEVVFWNQTPFNLEAMGFKEIKSKSEIPPKTDLYKRARKNIELSLFEKKFNDPVYRYYKFKPAAFTVKQKIKNLLVSLLTKKFSGEKGLAKLRRKLQNSVRGSKTYHGCLQTLEEEKPDFIFCTNQRTVNAIAPLLAAKDQGIPTGTFIFSWDNLPKATMVIETDYYFVWSDFMKSELLRYYLYIQQKQIKITGTPQFEPHYNPLLKISEKTFYKTYNLDPAKKYLCFSGDDITTSPHDPTYLRDVAQAVRKLNKKGLNLGIIFRRCPVDFSNRFDEVLKDFKDEIMPIAPLWEKQGDRWNTILPTREDICLQTSIIQHTFMVINVGSSMVFDYITQHKPCAYINYNPKGIALQKDIHKIYKYVHFRSMPSKNSVIWLNNKEEIAGEISKVLQDEDEIAITLSEAQNWFKKINKHPAAKSSQRIWEDLKKITT